MRTFVSLLIFLILVRYVSDKYFYDIGTDRIKTPNFFSASLSYRECKFRNLTLALESTGDLGCFDACVKNRIIFCFWVYSQN